MAGERASKAGLGMKGAQCTRKRALGEDYFQRHAYEFQAFGGPIRTCGPLFGLYSR